MKIRFLLIIILFCVSCSRQPQRDHNLSDNISDQTARTLYEVKWFQTDWINSKLNEQSLKDLKAVKIRSVKSGEEVKNSFSQAGAFIDPKSNVSFINRYYKLKYDFESDFDPDTTDLKDVKTDPEKLLSFLLGNVDKFYGFPDTEYYILPHFEGNYLVLYRLGKPETIPYDQLPLARRVGDFLATPLVGYKVKFCNVEKHKDFYGEVTDLDIINCVGGFSASSAKYIQMQANKENKEVFNYKSKLDIFPADFFNGTWFYLRTVVETGELNAGTIGHQLFEAANLVEFRKAPDQFEVVDASGYDMDEKDRVASFFIPVNRTEYEIDRDAETFNSFGERNKEIRPNIERPYFKMDFNRLISVEKTTYPEGQFKIRRLLVTGDSFNFDLEVSQEGVFPIVVKYSFKKAEYNEDYPQKYWNEEDSSKFFPLFAVKRRYYKRAVESTKKDDEKFYRTTRFDPDKSEIRWYFSTQTPKDNWVRDFARKAIHYENLTFREAGKDSDRAIKIVLDESEDKELGDMRYNIINLIVTESLIDSLAGYGPRISNPITGEILSSTANIWVSSILDNYIRIIQRYIRFHVWPFLWNVLPGSHGFSDFIHEKIVKLCPEVISFIDVNKGKIHLHPTKAVLDDKNIQVTCSKKMARTEIFYTIMHEIRHGFGFRHVFSASADKANYWKDYDEIRAVYGDSIFPDDITKSFKTPAQYSSVMDYGSFRAPQPVAPGKYDIAATRFLYFDQVETVNEQGEVDGFMDVPLVEDNILTIAESENIPAERVKRYHVCGGKRVYLSHTDTNPDDPLCVQFDYGSTPNEVVKNAIRDIKTIFMMTTRRYDSQELSENYFKSTMAGLLIKSVTIFRHFIKWSQLRNNLLKSKGRELFDFYENTTYDADSYQKIIETALGNPEFKLYYEIIPTVFDFVSEVFFMPPKHCIYQKDGTFQAVSLDIIRDKLKIDFPDGSREILIDCQSPVVKKFSEQNKLGQFVAEIGSFLSDTHFFIKPLPEDSLDEFTMFGYSNVIVAVLLEVLDEPLMRDKMIQRLKKYVMHGMDFNPYLDGKQFREALNLDEDVSLPELPLFPNWEIMETQGSSFHLLNNLQAIHTKVFQKTRYDEVKKRTVFDLHLVDLDPVNIQIKIDQLTQNSINDQGLRKVYSAYGDSTPFIYQAYENYAGLYKNDPNRPEFGQFLKDLPETIYVDEKRILLLPFDQENMYVDFFRKYNENKECLNASHCPGREHKEAFNNLIKDTALATVSE